MDLIKLTDAVEGIIKQQDVMLGLLTKVVSNQVVPAEIKNEEIKEAGDTDIFVDRNLLINVVNSKMEVLKDYLLSEMSSNFSSLCNEFVSIRKEIESLSRGLETLQRREEETRRRLAVIETQQEDEAEILKEAIGDFDEYRLSDMDKTIDDHEDRLYKLEEKYDNRFDNQDRQDFEDMRRFYFHMKEFFEGENE